MKAEEIKRISKSLSKTLRHKPERVGIRLDERGWALVDDLLDAYQRSGMSISLTTLKYIVDHNDKRRFEFSRDGQRIRARQGHSIEIDLGYKLALPPDVLYHGTATRFLDSILQQGLVKGSRHHVHLSTDKVTMLAVGQRHGKPVLLAIDAARMVADGHEFFVTGNDVWLTDHVPASCLTVGG